MKIRVDYVNIRIPILRFLHSALGSKVRYPTVDSVPVGSVVVTQNCHDVGLVAETSNGKPIKVYARVGKYSDMGTLPQYGGVNSVCWYDTGVHMSLKDWVRLSRSTDAYGFYQYWQTRLHIKD